MTGLFSRLAGEQPGLCSLFLVELHHFLPVFTFVEVWFMEIKIEQRDLILIVKPVINRST